MTSLSNVPDGSAVAGGRAEASPRIVLLALAVGGFAIGTTEFSAMALLPYFSAGLGVDPAEASNAISAYALGVVVGAPLIAVFGARMARRDLLIALMTAYGIFNILGAMSPSFTMLMVFRFLAGLPHGAYFGVASLLAASMVPPKKRTQAVARVLMGLTVATILGVPFSNILGQTVGWRWGFGMMGALAALTAALIFLYAPRTPGDAGARPLRELGALKRGQVWLTLATVAVGFGGFFSVYTFLANTMLSHGQSAGLVPVALAVLGVGMTAGTLLTGWLADRGPVRTVFLFQLLAAVTMGLYPLASAHVGSLMAVLFFIGCSAGLCPVIQTRLMDVAGEAQTLAAALNHSAFNIANAIGPALAALALRGGLGFSDSGYVGAALSLGGAAVFAVTVWDAKRRPMAD